MSPEEKSYIKSEFKNLNEKIDLVINPVKADVTKLEGKVEDFEPRIMTLENFKDGHQQAHIDKESSKRFRWEILAGSGVIGGIMAWLKIGGHA